jgi:hypothetical protein
MRTGALVCAVAGILLAAEASALRGDPGSDKNAADAKAAEKALVARLQETLCIGGPEVGYEIWWRDATGLRLSRPVFIRLDAQGRNQCVIVAKEAELRVDARKSQLMVTMQKGVASSRDDDGQARFEEMAFAVPLPAPKAGPKNGK